MVGNPPPRDLILSSSENRRWDCQPVNPQKNLFGGESHLPQESQKTNVSVCPKTFSVAEDPKANAVGQKNRSCNMTCNSWSWAFVVDWMGSCQTLRESSMWIPFRIFRESKSVSWTCWIHSIDPFCPGLRTLPKTTCLPFKWGVASSLSRKIWAQLFWNNIPSLKLTWHLKMDGFNTSFLLGWPIFRGYVSFRECKAKKTFWDPLPQCTKRTASRWYSAWKTVAKCS